MLHTTCITGETKLIYGLKDPRTDEIRYVGRSSSGLERPATHGRVSLNPDNNSHKARWIRELRAENLTYDIVVLELCRNDDHLVEAEERWIWAGFRLGWPLTNGTFDGGKPIEVSQETRAKIAAAKRGKPRPNIVGRPRPDVAARNRQVQSRETIEKRVISNMISRKKGIPNLKLKGIPRTEEAKAKMRAGWAARKARMAVIRGQGDLGSTNTKGPDLGPDSEPVDVATQSSDRVTVP